MSSLYVLRGALRRKALLPQSSRIFSRSNFFERPARGGGSTSLLPSTPARTRFAPSPTGYLHIGSLRTALFNYLLAKATGGQFLVRIEDTDQRRLVPDAEEKLCEDLKWAGLTWDEGPDIGGPYEPYKQSSRLHTYKEHAHKLLEDGHAYRCFCSPEELDAMKKLALEEHRDPVYNKKCTHIPVEESAQRAENGEEYCIRFRSGATPLVQDLVYGTYKSPVPLDDYVLLKRDQFPTYHFANVIDDHLMEITHVIRGAEWLVSTPRHVALYNAFEWQAPQFAHVGLLVDQKKQKLSKRFGGFNVSTWKEKGMLPIALLNYVLLLGWSPSRDSGEKSEIMDMNDMIRKFHLRFTKGDVTVNSKDEFLQKAHMRKSLSKDGRDKDSVVASLVPGLTSVITQCEEARHVSNERATAANEGILLTDLGVRIGELVPSAQPTNDSTAVSEAHVKTLIELDGNAYTKPMAFLKRNVYLVWQIPEQEHVDRLWDQKAVSQGGQKTVVLWMMSPHEIAKLEHKETIEPVREPIRMLTVSLLERLQEVKEEDWTEPRIKDAIGQFIDSVRYYSTNDEQKKMQRWGWKYLRWVIYGSAEGPGLTHSMAFLGRDEILRRVRQAKDITEKLGV